MALDKPVTGEDLHSYATDLADECQRRSHEKFASVPADIVRGALFNILHDAVIVHRAIGVLVASGWSSPGAILARTMLDLTVSLVAVLGSRNPPLAAFRYFNASFRQIMRDGGYTPKLRREVRAMIRDQISRLPLADRPAALEFLKEKDRPYWFADEWKSPSEVIATFASPVIQQSYRSFSAAAHGGFLGGRIFRDRSFESTINPRLPVGKQATLVSVSSSRYLVELVLMRSQYEELGLEPLCKELLGSIETIEILKTDIS